MAQQYGLFIQLKDDEIKEKQLKKKTAHFNLQNKQFYQVALLTSSAPASVISMGTESSWYSKTVVNVKYANDASVGHDEIFRPFYKVVKLSHKWTMKNSCARE